MPVWMDILLNVIGYAGFVGVATFNHAPQPAQTEQLNEPSAPVPRYA